VRIYTNPFEAMKETARDLQEMGIEVHTKTMQDKDIAEDPRFVTRELQGYGFKITDWSYDGADLADGIFYLLDDRSELDSVLAYIKAEHQARVGGIPQNPGTAWVERKHVWREFLDERGEFAYTYSERFAPQIAQIVKRLQDDNGSRQAIITMHSNIIGCGSAFNAGRTILGTDFFNAGGGGRIPCSMYYQVMVRKERVDLIYTMRSCDLLTHFPVDIALALELQLWFADQLKLTTGAFTYFAGSLHAYAKDLKKRGEF